MLKVWLMSIQLAFAVYMCDGNDTESVDDCNMISSNPDSGLVCDESIELVDDADDHSTFAMRVNLSVFISSSGIIETRAMTRLLLLMRINKDDADSMELSLCHLKIPAIFIPGQSGPTQMLMDESIFLELETVKTVLNAPEHKTCAAIRFPEVPFVFSIQIEDKLNDPMLDYYPDCITPVETDCVFDMDNDGFPGVTFQAENIPGIDVRTIFMVMRATLNTDSIFGSQDLILGRSDWSIEQRVLGCTIVPLGQNEPRLCNASELDIVRKVNPVLSPVPGIPGNFYGIRVTNEMNCEDLIYSEDYVFGR
ncbi:MAG: hypothetical protein JXR95_07460 [Deltaproteobacteria bacterium]|nr:hypothetical protein [Deltaproteobacteria bacterium]